MKISKWGFVFKLRGEHGCWKNEFSGVPFCVLDLSSVCLFTYVNSPYICVRQWAGVEDGLGTDADAETATLMMYVILNILNLSAYNCLS